MDLSPDILVWVEAAVGSGARVLTIDPLPPSSTEQHVVVLGAPSGSVRVVTRRYHDRDRLAADFAYDPSNEAAALALLAPTDVPAPRLLAADLGGVVSGAPLLLESWVGGDPAWQPADLDAYLSAAAAVLVGIHAVPLSEPSPVRTYRPYRDQGHEARPAATRSAVWDRVLEAIARPAPAGAVGFIHRDYHPGNALWDGATVNVVDWSTAASGPRGIDLARMRQNLAGWHGRETADRFVERYVAAGGDPDARHPYWDLLDAADLLDEEDLAAPGGGELERFEDYVQGVLAELG
jgi:aminoglycoside phosphotransferase (APT) family kinase protein